MSALLEVQIVVAADASGAQAGGADRLALVGDTDEVGLSPEPRLVGEVRRRSPLPLRPLVRLREGFSTDGGEVARLKGLVAAYTDEGADGLVLGFLNRLGEVDLEVLRELLADTALPWTFHRGIDTVLDFDKVWQVLPDLPGLDAVATGGSARGLDHGLDEIVARAENDPRAAALILAAGGLRAEHVPWLLRAGVRQFHLDAQARPGGSYKAYVDAELVGSWRKLLDDEWERAHPER